VVNIGLVAARSSSWLLASSRTSPFLFHFGPEKIRHNEGTDKIADVPNRAPPGSWP